ncbi:hypothetical protein Q2404_24330, partial [Escherichia coli]|nr:hypothetical protein [Escherichia coli]
RVRTSAASDLYNRQAPVVAGWLLRYVLCEAGDEAIGHIRASRSQIVHKQDNKAMLKLWENR